LLSEVVAIRFDRVMKSGRTAPLLMACERTNGEVIEVVAKFAGGKHLGPLGLMRESLCAMLAKDLGLPVPECFVVRIDPNFVASIARSAPAVAATLATSLPLGFGSARLPAGFSAWMPERRIPKAMRASAAEIFAFDLLVQNTDRRPDNPNLQSRGDLFAIFDHELALMIEGVLFWKPPWEPGSLEAAAAPDKHLLRRKLQGTEPDLTRLVGAWEAINDQRLAEYRSALPLEWAEPSESAEAAIAFLRNLRDHVYPAAQEVLRVLK
jgi:hypothetical protein